MPVTTSTAQQTVRGTTAVNLVMLNGEALDVTAREASIMRTEGQHDQASLVLSSVTLTDTEGLVEKPISFVYGRAPFTDTFYGYVTNVATLQGDGVNFTFTISALGSSMAMQENTPHFWANKSVTSAVQDLALGNLLGFHGAHHPYNWKALAQTRDTDWATAVSFAGRIGYSLFPWNGIIMCFDPVTLYATSGSYTSLIARSDVTDDERQLIEFTPDEESTEQAATMGISLSFLGSDGQIHVLKQPNYTKYRYVPLTVRDQGEAELYLQAFDRATTRWNQDSMARIWGDASIYPSMCVDITTTNPGTNPNKYNGKWLVRSVVHKMDPQNFQTMLGLSRPKTNQPSQTLTFRHFWDHDERARPTMTLDQGKWVSSWADRRVRATL